MGKSIFDKISEFVVGTAPPEHLRQYGQVVIPWHKRLWLALRPPDRVPNRRQPLSSKQRRLIGVTLAAIAVLGLGGASYRYLTTGQERSMALFREGMRLLGPNNLTGAKEKFTEAIAVWPENARAFLERGNVNRILGDRAGALEDWSRAIDLNPKLSDAFTARGTMHRLQGDHARALTDLNHAIDISPSMDAFFQRGQVFHALGEHRKALEDYSRSIDQQPNAPYVYRARSLTRSLLGDAAGAHSDELTADRLESFR